MEGAERTTGLTNAGGDGCIGLLRGIPKPLDTKIKQIKICFCIIKCPYLLLTLEA